MITRGGENIYPREIEDVLFAHPAVAEVLPPSRKIQKFRLREEAANPSQVAL